MKISAKVRNDARRHEATVRTDAATRTLDVPARATGQGSGVNGGEFLMLALATCYCNDIYREAARMNIVVDAVEVEASADFPGVGLAATNIRYNAFVSSPAPTELVRELLNATDAVAEIHNTIRAGVPVTLEAVGALAEQ
ncbi:MAG: OsmC family protein [Proteobacteria bacterium]|nr:OsmC family protein [Pseudomonadota bacterium]